MKTSVLIIAHNEEKYIKKCIDSVLEQSRKADEVVLISHNCTDQTAEIARKYPITVVPFEGEAGPVYARMEGLEHVSGDIVLCLDGDSFAEKNWISEMASLFQEDVVLVGSWVKFSRGAYSSFSNFFNKKSCTKSDNATHWLWGPSFGFLKKDKNNILTAFGKSIEISEKLRLSRNPDDYILALFMKRFGDLEITNKTYVTVNVKEKGIVNEIKRSVENIGNGHKIERFLKSVVK